MSNYVVGDIHACYDDLQKMIQKIKLSEDDTLFMVGDYIDRGDQNVEMLKWLENLPDNILPVRGNHDENFAYYVYLMKMVDQISDDFVTDPDSNEDTTELYFMTSSRLDKIDRMAASYFDMYGTLIKILSSGDVTLTDLDRWANVIRSFPLYRELTVNDRRTIIVHAGYKEDIEDEEERERFFLEARDPAYTDGGIEHGMVVAGHTPTFAKGEFVYNKGDVFRFHKRFKDCIYYDIDCGCVFRKREPMAKLACLRLEDEEIFYV